MSSSLNSDGILANGARILVTGAGGFIGRNLIKMLENFDVSVFTPTIEECDLTTNKGVKEAFSCNPDVVIHLAADVGGIGYMSSNSFEIFQNNSLMDLLVIRESVSKNVKKFIGVGSVNCYPSLLESPYEEENLWRGQPHDSVLGYGSSKRNLILQCQMLRSQQKLNATVLIFEGVYGPGDNFARGRSRVIPANIVRCIDAINSGDTEISAWGTGNPIRDFLFVNDASRAIIFSIENSDSINSLNVGSGMPVSIRELLEKIVQVTGFKGKLVWDESKPDGQKIRYLSNSKALDLGFQTKTILDEGLHESVNWYLEHLSAK